MLHLHDGTASSCPQRISDAPPLARDQRRVHAKYAEAMVAYGMELVAIAEKFHVVIELEPTDLQAW